MKTLLGLNYDRRGSISAFASSNAVNGIALAVLFLVPGCKSPSRTESASAVRQGSDTTVLATVGAERITMADIHERSGDDLDKIDTQYRLIRSRIITSTLDSILREKTVDAEAKRTGKSVDDLVAAEAPKGFDPSDDDIRKWFNENPDRTGGRTIDQLHAQIVGLLHNERRNAAIQKLEERLKRERNVVVNYQRYRLQFTNEGAPTMGKKDAPVTLVEFSDFQCPFCRGMAPTVKQVAQKFGDKVQIVYRQFPIPSLHPNAFKAAEASLCANDQGKFWEMHDAMFENQEKLTVSDLKQKAKRLGLDEKKFNSCLDSGKYVEQVQNDTKEGQKSGVNGTPALFVNGVAIDGGSVPFSAVQAAIEKELARVGSGQ